MWKAVGTMCNHRAKQQSQAIWPPAPSWAIFKFVYCSDTELHKPHKHVLTTCVYSPAPSISCCGTDASEVGCNLWAHGNHVVCSGPPMQEVDTVESQTSTSFLQCYSVHLGENLRILQPSTDSLWFTWWLASPWWAWSLQPDPVVSIDVP